MANLFLYASVMLVEDTADCLATLTGFAPFNYSFENSKPIVREAIYRGPDCTLLRGNGWAILSPTSCVLGMSNAPV